MGMVYTYIHQLYMYTILYYAVYVYIYTHIQTVYNIYMIIYIYIYTYIYIYYWQHGKQKYIGLWDLYIRNGIHSHIYIYCVNTNVLQYYQCSRQTFGTMNNIYIYVICSPPPQQNLPFFLFLHYFHICHLKNGEGRFWWGRLTIYI